MVKLGIIGCGAMGQRHAAAAKAAADVELVAVADPVESRAAAITTDQSVAAIYSDGMQLLEDERVQAVVLAMPTALRSPLAFAALERGRHVLLEKPAAMNVADLERMMALRGDRVVACASSRYRFLPSAKQTTAFLASQPLGPIRSMFIREFSPAKPAPDQPKPTWRLSRELNGGGVLVNWGCYDLDYMLGLLNWRFEPVSVMAQTWSVPPRLQSHVPPQTDAETHLVATIRGCDGSILHIERGEYLAAPPGGIWQIIGDDGTVQLCMKPMADKRVVHHYLDEKEGACEQVIWEGDEDANLVHTAPLHDFADAIIHGHTPTTGLEQSLVLQRITDAIYASASCGQTVNVGL